MSKLWWQLPGPSAFLRRLVEALRETSVLLCLPKWMPEGLYSALRVAYGDGTLTWEHLDVTSKGEKQPAEYMVSLFAPETPPGDIWNAGVLLRSRSFAGRLIWLEGITLPQWAEWQAFLAEYARASWSVDNIDRTVFCVPLVGELAQAAESAREVGLRALYWRECVDHLDMLLFTSHLLDRWSRPSLQRRLLCETIASLALWDPTVAEYLADEADRRDGILLKAEAVLREIAAERGWDVGEPQSAQPEWCQGAVDGFEGEEQVHSAFLAVREEGRRELERRIWKAQVRVLFPYLEQQRHEMLNKANGLLEVPYKTTFGTINDRLDLELGHMYSQLRQKRYGVNPELIARTQLLKDIRNQLAHGEPVDAALLRELR